MRSLLLLFTFLMVPVAAFATGVGGGMTYYDDPVLDRFPAQAKISDIPDDARDFVLQVYLCSSMSEAIGRNTTPNNFAMGAKQWYSNQCGTEALEAKQIQLQEKYKNNDFVHYLIERVPPYKD